MSALIVCGCTCALVVLGAITLYEWALAFAALMPARPRRRTMNPGRSRFVVLIPAHNEESTVAETLRSLQRVDYPSTLTRIVVVADRCHDGTASVAQRCGAECFVRCEGESGKGAAIGWAVSRLLGGPAPFDAVVIVDADTVVDPSLLMAFDEQLRAGHDVQQGYNYLSNPWETPFTRIIAVTSVLRNGLFYQGKERVGLPAMLSGTGMCFSRAVLTRHGWNAFSVGEDWEFSASLLLSGEQVHFNPRARVMARESRGFGQASSQRLRWASGRHAVAGNSAWRLARVGITQRRIGLCDAALTIVAPTYSLQASLAVICLAASCLLPPSTASTWLTAGAAAIVAALAGYFFLGVMLTESPSRALAGVVLIPAFLPWRMAIELLGLAGFGRKQWVRTSRSVTLLALLSLLCAPRVHAQVIFQDDFEADTIDPNAIIGAWDGPHDPTTMYLTDQMSHSGKRALELKYVPGSFGASFMYHEFPGHDQVYVRWYQRWSSGFVWEPSATKMVILRPIGGYPQFYPEVLWADGQLAIQAQVTAEAHWDSENFYQNVGDPITFAGDRWYCVEVFVKLNTPGVADGEVDAWIDGSLKLQYSGRQFRGASPLDPAPSIAQIQAVGATGYYGGVTQVPQLQYSWQDDFVVSTQPIGFEFLSDDLESDTTNPDGTVAGWDGPARPSVMYASDTQAHSGVRALQLDYLPGTDGAGYMYRYFPPQRQIFLRWYQRWSPGFMWEPSGTGLMGIRSSTYPEFYPFTLGTGGLFAIQAQVVAEQNFGSENFLPNVGDPFSFVSDRWYCVEVYVKLNAPGAADGELAAWIDGDQKIAYTGRQFVGDAPDAPAPSTARIGSLLVTAQYGGLTTVPQLQHAWQDDFVGSTERIGCGDVVPIHIPLINGR